ncbi:LuxR C-terminal-related transcriptional regulator [Parapedobacter deserti]|uniref:LuxR C-terminal-related transcriptional regulator n=1 Tax=Parapedobacter deserti TaxID=1912957 RepID=A0ABV7JHL6_9SPHI
MGNSLANIQRNIFLTYSHEIIGVAMKWLLEKYFPMSIIGEARNFQETLNDLPKKEYDLVVLDAEIADSTHLLGVVEHIKSLSPKTRILIFSELDEAIYGPKYIAFGTNGYLAKNADIDSIVEAIKIALDGETEVYKRDKIEETSNEFVKSNLSDTLSQREAQIAELLVKGTTLTEISKKIGLRDTTISTYKKRIFEKVGVKTLSDLIAVWKIYK